MNADCEVKKLKDLVKKLERQNQHLRYKTGKLGPHRNSSTATDLLSDGSDESYKSGILTQILPALEDSIDESYFKSINNANDTCWLFSLGKLPLAEDREALELWLRHDLEHPPTAALALAKRNILNSLDAPVKSKQEHHREEPIKSKSPIPQNDVEDTFVDYYNKEETVNHRSQTSHHVRHMPIPSHTTASVYGLVPNVAGERLPRSPSPGGGPRQLWDSGDRMHQNQSPSRGARQQSPVRTTRQQSPTRTTRPQSPVRTTRQQSPSRAARQPSPSRGTRQHMPLPSQTAPPGHTWSASSVPDSYHSTVSYSSATNERPSRHRSPSPAQRSHRSPSPGQRSHRSPSPSYRVPSQSTSIGLGSSARGPPSMRTEVAMAHDKSQSNRRIPGPSTPRSVKSTTSRKDGALTPRLASSEKLASDRYMRNTPGLYSSGTPKGQSGIPSRKSGLPSSRSIGGRHLKYLQTSELRGAVSTEELYSGSNGDGNSDRSRTLTPRRFLPRPSRATKNHYSNMNHEVSKYGRADSVRSLELHHSESVRSDETTSEASDVWKDGEFF